MASTSVADSFSANGTELPLHHWLYGYLADYYVDRDYMAYAEPMDYNSSDSAVTAEADLSIRDLLGDNDRLPDELSKAVKLIFTIAYVTIITLAIGGNLLVITVISKAPAMRTVTNTFLVSLAVSDLCIASINMPFQLRFYLHNEWTLGEALCKFSKYMQGVVIVASILTLTGVAIDR